MGSRVKLDPTNRQLEFLLESSSPTFMDLRGCLHAPVHFVLYNSLFPGLAIPFRSCPWRGLMLHALLPSAPVELWLQLQRGTTLVDVSFFLTSVRR